MIEDHLKNIEKEIALIREELEPPAQSNAVKVSTQAELQQAIDNAPVNTKILIKPGTYDLIILRNGRKQLELIADTSLPGGRANPEWNESLVKVRSFRCEPKAESYNLKGFNFLPSTPEREIVALGTDKDTDPFNTPKEIIFDQCVLTADPNTGGKRGFRFNCRDVSVSNSYISGFWYSSDSQAILCYNGPGPYYIYNNYLEASGENFMVGGADSLNESMQPQYVEFIGNHCFKPEEWKTQPNTTVKNLFEIKDCIESRVENNLFEGCWKDGQVGYGIVFSPRNQNNREPFTVVSNVSFSWNVIRNIGAGINILGDDNLAPSLVTTNIVIENNYMYQLDPIKHTGSAGRVILITRNPRQLRIRNNTMVGIPKINAFLDIENSPENLIVSQNIFTEGSYGLKTPKGLGQLAFNQQCISSEFVGNVIIPSNVRTINYGPSNLKEPNAIDPATGRSLVSAGVDIDLLRARVKF